MDEDVFAAQRTDNYYYPFANGDEWDFGRFLTTSSLRMREIDEFLKLPIVQKHLLPHLTFKSAKELRQRVELLPTGPRWVAQTIKYPGFPTKRPIVLFYRNSLDCAQLILRHPVLKKHIDLIPTLLTQGGERIHKEWINSDSAWQMQQAIPAGRTVLGIVASSDKTNISVMNGDRVAHPFLLSLANLHSEVASKASSNAFIMTALLPVPKFLCEKKLRGIMEKRLLHQCLDIICGPLKLAARDGAPLSTSDGGIIVAHTPLVSYIVDTPEAADLSGVKGKTSHLTMASHKTFGDAVRQPERTGASTWEAICSVTARVSPDDVAAYQKAAKAHPNRLSGVHLPFWRDWPLSTDPSKFLTPEVLHHIHKAFFDHDFQWGRTILGDAEIDFRLSLLHPRSGSRHFHDGVTRLKQLGGREHRELQRSFISIIAEAAPREVLCALRALMDFRFMAQAPQIDESTLIRMEALLAQFHELKHHIIEANGREQDHFNIPKLELLHSIVPSIRWAGVPMQYTADITEKAHSTQIKVPARTETNHRDYDPQIVRHLDRAEKLRLFTLYTNTRTEGLDLDLDDPGEEEDEEDASGSSLVGESNGRTMRNLFQAAVIYPTLYPGTETRFETTPSTAYLLNRRASLASISVEDVASMFAIPDLRAALGDYFSARGQRRSPLIGGRRRSQNDCVLPFTHLEIWYSSLFPGRAAGVAQSPRPVIVLGCTGTAQRHPILLKSAYMQPNSEVIYRPNAIRALCHIIDLSMAQGVKRFFKAAIVERNPSISSASLISAYHLFSQAKVVMKRWVNGAQEAVNVKSTGYFGSSSGGGGFFGGGSNQNASQTVPSSSNITQYHALGLLYLIRQQDRLAVTKMIQQLGGGKSGSGTQWRSAYSFDRRHKSGMVNFEAARVICEMKNFRNFSSPPKPVLKFAATRTLATLALNHPASVAACNVDLENLITDANRSVATYAITTLFKTGNKASVDRLIKQITGFMSEISNEFKVIIVDAIRSLCLKFPAKHAAMLTFLSGVLRDEGGYDFKRAVVEAMFDMIKFIGECREQALSHLCEFVEDCEFTKLSYIRFIYNRVVLEKAPVRAAAVSSLAEFGLNSSDDKLNQSVGVLVLNRRLDDVDDKVRDRAAMYLKVFKKQSLVKPYVKEDSVLSLALESKLVAYVKDPAANSAAFDVSTIPKISRSQAAAEAARPSSLETIGVPATKQAASAPPAPTAAETRSAYAEQLAAVPSFALYGSVLNSSVKPVQLTESETEYQVTCVKHIFREHVVFQFNVSNTLPDTVPENVTIAMQTEDEGLTQDFALPIPSVTSAKSPAIAYVSFTRDELEDYAIASFQCMLQFVSKELDPATGEPEEEGYEDEYQTEEVEVSAGDVCIVPSYASFGAEWDRMKGRPSATEPF
ncbi:hypothetical protein MKEN_00422400 [Mycena kentingensis (nom. inval.)]|nr:hypothetical protein MKEN_00422400 [Mycena kentingensis (nom. inval.)]